MQKNEFVTEIKNKQEITYVVFGSHSTAAHL